MNQETCLPHPSDFFQSSFHPSPDHPAVYRCFTSYQGIEIPGYSYNFLGVKTDKQFTSGIHTKSDEDVIEMTDLLEAVVEAKKSFVMIELGAGYGKWLVNAAAALRQIHPQMPYRLIGVEAEPTHFKWMKQHFFNNDVPLQKTELIYGAVSSQKGAVDFYMGEPERWYGQAIASEEKIKTVFWTSAYWKALFQRYFQSVAMRWTDQDTGFQYEFHAKVRRVKTVQLETLLKKLDHVDLIDMDIQGEEFKVLYQARQALHQKVKRVHIGTHSAKIENDLRGLFSSLGWSCLRDYPMGKKSNTPFGAIAFCDGVQTWGHPHL